MTLPTDAGSCRPEVRRPWLAGAAALNALVAWAGAAGLASGAIDFGQAIDDRLPFGSLILAGLALVVVVAIPLSMLAWSAWNGGRRTADLALVAGILLIGWIVGQVAVIRAFSGFQPTYLVVGTGFIAASLAYESVTLTTTDGVDLAGWYLPGTNGAGVVVMHGAGSTRSDVLDQATVLAGSGYAVVVIDARGHGDSAGAAMDFGWYGNLDIAAATQFLASRVEVDPDRIGVVGFSMGGEEAISAAAADQRIHAVVAEGATGRQAADKAWLSDIYGWRGWVQEQLDEVQTAFTDYLTPASPPTSLRSAVAGAADTRFLLITAGTVEDETHAASFIREGASERVTVWNVEGAEHTGGYATRSDEWRQRVLDFLESALGSESPG